MTPAISADNFNVLSDPALDTPKSREPGDLAVFLAEQNRRFFDVIKQFDGPLADGLSQRAYWMQELATTLEAVVDLVQKGRRSRAWELMEDILDEHLGTLKIMSLRHALKVVGSASWYRMTTWDAKTRRDIFHRPFQMAPVSFRFSAPGRPAIYLGNSAYLCFLECQGKEELLAAYRVARFEVELRGNEYFLDLPANHQCYVQPLQPLHPTLPEWRPSEHMNSPYVAHTENELLDYLSVWPLLMGITVQKLEPAPADPPEYILPQLLMRWVLKQTNMLGIRYFTSKHDPATNTQDLSINVVLPTRTTKAEGFCDFLTERARCTLPQSFTDVMRVPDATLFTASALDARGNAGGRVMLKVDKGIQHYHTTPFGRMEYWLDRPEQTVQRIDSSD